MPLSIRMVPSSIKSLGTLWRLRRFRWIAVLSALAYWLAFLFAIQDLTVHARVGPVALTLADRAWELMFQPRGPFHFEPIALLQLPFLTWTFAPLNAATGAVLAALVGLNISLAWLAVSRPRACRARPAAGILAALPGLLAGSACCGPVLFIVLGLPISASVIGLFGMLVPAAVVLLVLALLFNLRRVDAQSALA
ncbi:hypothetical protein [Nitrococcus mobilis]|nr:hypothetical protein [Nitrococcus mobilis]